MEPTSGKYPSIDWVNTTLLHSCALLSGLGGDKPVMVVPTGGTSRKSGDELRENQLRGRGRR